MTTPTPENRDPDRAEPRTRPRLDLSVTKVAAGACAAALAAAVGSKLGVAGTIAGAAVASVVATSASAVIGHSLERGKSAARKAMPVLDPEQLETAILARARIARAERAAREGDRHPAATAGVLDDTRVDARTQTRTDTHIAEPAALTRVDETHAKPSLADRALTDVGLHEAPGPAEAPAAIGPHAQTMLLQKAASEAPRTWRDRIPGRKPLLAAAVASFMLGTGAVTALEVARKGEFPGYHSNVFTNDPGQSGGSHDQPAPENPGGSGTHQSSTPSQKPDSSPTTSGSSSSSPSGTASTPVSSDSTPSAPSTPSTGPSTGPTAPSTTPTTAPTGSANPTTAPATPGATTQSSTAGGLGMATPTGGATG